MPRGGFRAGAGRKTNAFKEQMTAAMHDAAEDLFAPEPVVKAQKPAKKPRPPHDPLDQAANQAEAAAAEQQAGAPWPFGTQSAAETPPEGKSKQPPASVLDPEEVFDENLTSLALFQRIYRDPRLPVAMRLNAASLAAPYEHAKMAPVTKGKKGQQAEDAKDAVATGRFRPRQAPAPLRAVN